jgi:malate dehydrogenase
MERKVKRIAITGGGGQIGYSLLFRLAAGELFGTKTSIELCIHDLEPSVQTVLKGVVMELEDGLYPLLTKVRCTSDLNQAFEGADLALLIGAKPRSAGMERKDLLKDNGEFFKRQGQALNRAQKEALVFVVGNPCNTNCLIALHHASGLKPENFHAMTRLDQNRAVFQLAKKTGFPIETIKNVAIWGNHSATLVSDFLNAKINSRPLLESFSDRGWLEGEFFKIIQQRGAEIIKLRGKSSAASATQAILDGLKALVDPKKENGFFSSAVISRGNPYGIKEDLVFSFPLRVKTELDWQIVPGLLWDSFLEERIRVSEKELLAERDAIAHLL